MKESVIEISQRKCECPIDAVANIIGSKWNILIIRDLFLGKKHFNEFLKQNEGLSNKVLTQKLQELTTLGMIHKKLSEDRICYELTQEGKALKPVLQSLAEYGKRYCKKLTHYQELIQKI